MDETQCVERVHRGCWSRTSQCNRKAWKDGRCKQHHPDTVKARREASEKRYDEERKQQPWYKLQEAHKRIAELEAEIAALRTSNAHALAEERSDDSQQRVVGGKADR